MNNTSTTNRTDKLRFGILGTAQIARKNWKAIRNSGNGIVTAVASRELARSRQFISECQREAPFEVPPTALSNYDELLASPDVEAVYIPLPTGIRKEWVVRAAQAGKHVVCEKPCARNVAELQEMLDACRRHQVQFMDGVMFMHSRRLDRIREVLDDGTSVGRINRIAAQFSFRADDEFLRRNIRTNSDLEPHGCLGDLGWYCIRFALWAQNWQRPREVRGCFLSQTAGNQSPAAVPTEFSGELFFDEGASASFYCSFLTENQQWAHVSGEKGSLSLSDFVLPFHGDELVFEVQKPEFKISGCDFNMEAGARRMEVLEHSNSHPTAQESNMFRNFATQIRSGKLNEAWSQMALKTQQVMEACLNSARAGGRGVSC